MRVQNCKPQITGKKFVKIGCKCPRSANRECNWFVKNSKVSNYEDYVCHAPATTEPPVTIEGNGTTNGNETVEA